MNKKAVVDPGQTPSSIGWTPSQGDLVLDAVPKDSVEEEAAASSPHTPGPRGAQQDSPTSGPRQRGRRGKVKEGGAASPSSRADRPAASPPPKRPPSAFACYCRATRPALLAENADFKGLALGEQIKVFSAHYKELTDEEKTVYENEARDLRATFDENMKAYRARHPEVVKSKKKKNAGAKRRAKSKEESLDDKIEEPTEDEADVVRKAPSSDEEVLGRRRSLRLKEAAEAGALRPRQGVDMIVHHTDWTTRKKRRSMLALTDGTTGGEPLEEDPQESRSEHMTYKEYLQYDREQTALIEKARQARAHAKRINGSVMDEDLQLALALSLSESQPSTASTTVGSASAASSCAEQGSE